MRVSSLSSHLRIRALLAVLAGVVFVQGVPRVAWGQGQAASGKETAQKLQQEEKNRYRGGVGSPDEVFNNMKKLYKAIMVEGKDDSKVDKWYSPHLRDIQIINESRTKEVEARAWSRKMAELAKCAPPEGIATTGKAACPEPKCEWHDSGTVGTDESHRPWRCCEPKGDTFEGYNNLRWDANFKACCVRKAEAKWSSEAIACEHPKGDGWAGLLEYYFPTQALGWENDRTTTMIVDKQEVKKCVQQTGELMKGEKAVDWVTGAIKRNIDQANKLGGGGGSPANEAEIKSKVQQVIKEVHPSKEDNRFADSLQGEGLTLRPNFATLDKTHRETLAKRFCMRPEQFMKIMDAEEDKLQKGGGDGTWQSLDKNIPVWSNYCPKAVELMINPEMSALDNVDGTPTDFKEGMRAWKEDPMFCQRMNARDNQNLKGPSIDTSKIGDVIRKSGSAAPVYKEDQVGYTCRDGGKLNGSMVPVELYRHAAVERRTAIDDHALGFLIAAGLAAKQGMLDSKSHRSFYKRFEPRPYSNKLENDEKGDYHTFIGKKFTGKTEDGGKTNELGDPCEDLSGEDFENKTMSDQLYISDVTNKSFTQDPVRAMDGGGGQQGQKREVNRYVQGWAKDSKEDQKEITSRGLDEKSSNYAAPFRIFATCPKGYVRWRPVEDSPNHGLVENLNRYCREENFGGETIDKR